SHFLPYCLQNKWWLSFCLLPTVTVIFASFTFIPHFARIIIFGRQGLGGRTLEKIAVLTGINEAGGQVQNAQIKIETPTQVALQMAVSFMLQLILNAAKHILKMADLSRCEYPHVALINAFSRCPSQRRQCSQLCRTTMQGFSASTVVVAMPYGWENDWKIIEKIAEAQSLVEKDLALALVVDISLALENSLGEKNPRYRFSLHGELTSDCFYNLPMASVFRLKHVAFPLPEAKDDMYECQPAPKKKKHTMVEDEIDKDEKDFSYTDDEQDIDAENDDSCTPLLSESPLTSFGCLPPSFHECEVSSVPLIRSGGLPIESGMSQEQELTQVNIHVAEFELEHSASEQLKGKLQVAVHDV
ncbi:hypothetical protein KI387_019255, partial [Taxus chinensis]